MRLLFLLLLVLVVLNRIEAQTKPRIYYLHIKSDIRYRFATTVVTSKVVNPDLKSHESTFDVTLSNEAFISNFTLTVGTKTYVGNVTTRETAREVYLNDRSVGKSAAHVFKKLRETNTFHIQINVAAEQKVTFELRYQEVLQRKLGSYNHVVYVKPGGPVADLRIEMDIEETRKVTKLRIPPIESDLFTIKDQKDADAAVTITRPSPKRAHILFEPTLQTQTAQGSQSGLDCQFKVKYDVERKPDGGEILLVNGYFVHFFAPSGIKPKPKDVVFILDKSGSMKGRKLDQMKQAMSTILSKMQSNERVNILTFSSSVHPWEVVDKLTPATSTNIKRAATYINETYANGGTNIEAALRRGIALLDERKDKTRAPVLIFLTDGEPTVGQIDPDTILRNVIKFNEDKVPILALAFGEDADYNFIKKLAAQNNGFGRKIYVDFDAANQIADFYSEISVLLLQNVTFKYLPSSVDEKTLTKKKVPNFFEGSEVVVAGMMASEVLYDIKPNVIASDVNGELSFDVPADGVVRLKLTRSKDIYAITEKIWAYLKIKEWLQKMYASTSEMLQEELKQKITTLALKYNFVTPFTSMVVSLPNNLQSSPVDLLLDSPDIASELIQSSNPQNDFMSEPRSLQRSPILLQSSNRMIPSRDVSLFSDNQMQSSNLGMVDQFDGPTLGTVAPDTSLNKVPTSNGVKGSSASTRVATSSGTSANKMTVDQNRTPGSRNSFISTLPPHDSTSGYTLVSVKGVTLPLCLENPREAEETKRYTLFRDLDSGTTVSVGFIDSPSGITRITYVKIVAQTVTEIFLTHLVENGVRRNWISNTFYTYVQGSQGSGVKLEVTSLLNSRLIIHFDYTDNVSENIDGSLALPLRGEIKDTNNFQGFLNNKIKELSLLAKKTKKVRMMIPVELSDVMNCWIVRSSLVWTLKPIV